MVAKQNGHIVHSSVANFTAKPLLIGLTGERVDFDRAKQEKSAPSLEQDLSHCRIVDPSAVMLQRRVPHSSSEASASFSLRRDVYAQRLSIVVAGRSDRVAATAKQRRCSR
jgi:hypothetical protein